MQASARVEGRREHHGTGGARGGANTGFQDALGVLVRLIQRGALGREEIEEVIRTNCRRHGRPAPGGTSMQRRLERLRATFEESGFAVESLAGGGEGRFRAAGWRLSQQETLAS